MEDIFNGMQPQWKTTLMEDNLNERQPQWKTTSMDDNVNGRQPRWKMTWVYYFFIVGSAKKNSSIHSQKSLLASTHFKLCVLDFFFH